MEPMKIEFHKSNPYQLSNYTFAESAAASPGRADKNSHDLGIAVFQVDMTKLTMPNERTI